MITNWIQQLEKVQTRSDAVAFIRRLSMDLGPAQLDIRNSSLVEFLEAISSWLDESDEYYAYRGETSLHRKIEWKQLAEMIVMGLNYE